MAAQDYDPGKAPRGTREDPTTISHIWRAGGWQELDDEMRAGRVYFISRHVGKPRAVLIPVELYDRLIAAQPKVAEAGE